MTTEQEDVESQKDLLRVHRLTLHALLRQKAQHTSAYAPPSIEHGIMEARQNISRIKRVLREWDVSVTNHPDDEEIKTDEPFAVNFRLSFFDPKNYYQTSLVTNGYYVTPHRLNNEAPSISSTGRFFQWMSATFTELNRRNADYSSFTPERITYDNWNTLPRRLVSDKKNIIAYASSLINPVSNLILSNLEKQYKVVIRFVLEKDVKVGKLRSRFRQKTSDKYRTALLYEDQIYVRDTASEVGLDHGLIIRARPKTPSYDHKFWWIVAGSGRVASIAAQELLFSPAGCRLLNDTLITHEPNWIRKPYIAIIYSVHYDTKQTFNIPDFRYYADNLDWNLTSGVFGVDFTALRFED